MTHTVHSNSNITLWPQSRAKEILQNVFVIANTVKGDVPLFRDLGIDGVVIDRPPEVARTLIISQIYGEAATHEPRADIEKVSFAEEFPGKLNTILEVGFDEQ